MKLCNKQIELYNFLILRYMSRDNRNAGGLLWFMEMEGKNFCLAGMCRTKDQGSMTKACKDIDSQNCQGKKRKIFIGNLQVINEQLQHLSSDTALECTRTSS